MALILPLLVLCAALLALYVSPPDTLILGLDHNSFVRASMGTAFLLWMLLTGVRRAGPAGVARVIGSAASWALLIVSLTGVYAYRFELSDIAGRVMGEFMPAEPTVGRGGEVNVRRRLGGEYVVAAKINDKPVSLIFDTGASTVVLRAEDAAKVGINSRRARLQCRSRHGQRPRHRGADRLDGIFQSARSFSTTCGRWWRGPARSTKAC